MANVEIKLTKSYENAFDSSTFDTVVLREPTYKDTHGDALGPPSEWQPGPGGPVLYVYRSVIAAYIDRLAVSPQAECLGKLSAVDAMRLEKAVRDFFIDLEVRNTSDTAPTT